MVLLLFVMPRVLVFLINYFIITVRMCFIMIANMMQKEIKTTLCNVFFIILWLNDLHVLYLIYILISYIHILINVGQ